MFLKCHLCYSFSCVVEGVSKIEVVFVIKKIRVERSYNCGFFMNFCRFERCHYKLASDSFNIKKYVSVCMFLDCCVCTNKHKIPLTDQFLSLDELSLFSLL